MAAASPQPQPFRFASQRGGDKLALDGFVYFKKKDLAAGSVSWRCELFQSHKCTATCRTVLAGDHALRVADSKPHNHLPTPDALQTQVFNSDLRAKALAQPTASRKRLLADVFHEKSSTDLVALPTEQDSARVVKRALASDKKKKEQAALQNAAGQDDDVDLVQSSKSKVQRSKFKVGHPTA